MNKIIITGVVGKEPVCSISESGVEYAQLSIYTKRISKNEIVYDWFKCVAFNNIVTKVIKPYIHKGTSVFICGEMVFNSYEKRGKTKIDYSIVANEIIILKTTKEIMETCENYKDKGNCYDDIINIISGGDLKNGGKND